MLMVCPCAGRWSGLRGPRRDGGRQPARGRESFFAATRKTFWNFLSAEMESEGWPRPARSGEGQQRDAQARAWDSGVYVKDAVPAQATWPRVLAISTVLQRRIG